MIAGVEAFSSAGVVSFGQGNGVGDMLAGLWRMN